MEVLILSRESDNLGGVVNHLNSLKLNFNKNIQVTDFTIGQRKNSRNVVISTLQPLLDGLRLLHHLATHRYDIIHLNPSLKRKAVLRDGFFLAILKVIRKDNILLFFHGWDIGFFNTIRRNNIYSWVFRKVFSCSKILVLSTHFRDDLAQLGFDKEKIKVVTTMFEGPLFARVGKDRSDDNFQILFLSRLIIEKGIYELLDAFTELVPDNDSLYLVIAGDGPEFERLKVAVDERGLQHRVSMPGYIRGATKAQVMVNSDLFVLPSYSEGCPVSLLEAMAAGLPVISSRAGAIPEILESDKGGIMFDTISKDEIANTLRYFMANPSFVTSAGQYNRKVAWERYEASVVTKEIEKTYKEISNG